MRPKPQKAQEYHPQSVAAVKASCLYFASKLGDLIEEVRVVGGLVPSLLIKQENLEGSDLHVGTMELDIGFKVAILDEDLYRELSTRLRDAGFKPDKNEEGNEIHQTWIDSEGSGITVDFLIPPTEKGDRGGRIKHIERDFGAVIIPGLDLAFIDSTPITLEGKTSHGEEAKRVIHVCGPGAFVVLKALAFRNRGENKDAYDLHYIIRNYGDGPEDVIEHLAPLMQDENTRKALEIIREDFCSLDAVGVMRATAFLDRSSDEALRAEISGFMNQFLRGLE